MNRDERNIYVGSLPLDADETEVQGLFSPYGEVLKLTLMHFVQTHPSAAGNAV